MVRQPAPPTPRMNSALSTQPQLIATIEQYVQAHFVSYSTPEISGEQFSGKREASGLEQIHMQT